MTLAAGLLFITPALQNRLTAAGGVLYLALRGLLVLIDAWPGEPLQQHYFCFYVSVLSSPPRTGLRGSTLPRIRAMVTCW